MKLTSYRFKSHLYKLPLLAAVALLTATVLFPALAPQKASAAQITSRKLTMSSGSSASSNATTTYTLNFTVPTTGTIIKSFSADACTTAIGTCTTPTGFSVSSATISQPTNLGDASGWTVSTATAGSLRLSKTTDATTPTGSQTVVFNNVQNPTTANSTFYLRMTSYSDASWTTAIDTGTVAGAVPQQLTVTAAVAEILTFCVGSTAVDDVTTAIGTATSCSGSTVDLGTLDTTAINYSKTNGNTLNGVAIMRTNAINGSSVYYDAVQDTGTAHLGALRIPGSNCTTVPGSCITSKAAQGVLVAGTQNYGMTILGTNCGTETAAGYYTCNYTGAADAAHLLPVSGYIGKGASSAAGAICSPTNCNSDNGFKWDESGSAVQIASAASNNVVADEALVLKFAATPSITNTFGSYQVKVDFTAVPTF